jgi:hypothetical protein
MTPSARPRGAAPPTCGTSTPTRRAATPGRRAAAPIHRAYATYLRSMGALLVKRLDDPDATHRNVDHPNATDPPDADPPDAHPPGDAPPGTDPPDAARGRILPMISGILQGRQALRDRDRLRAVDHFACGLFHLALIACTDGDPHLRLLDFLRLQRERYDACRGRHRPPWWDRPPRHHFDRLIANALTAVYEIDARRPDRRRLRTHAADAANYALFFLQTSRVPLPRRPSHPLAPTPEIHAR